MTGWSVRLESGVIDGVELVTVLLDASRVGRVVRDQDTVLAYRCAPACALDVSRCSSVVGCIEWLTGLGYEESADLYQAAIGNYREVVR